MAKKVGKRVAHECLLPSPAVVGADEVWACDCGKEYYAMAGGAFAGGPRWVSTDNSEGPSHLVEYDKVEEPKVVEVEETPKEETTTEVTETAEVEEVPVTT